MKWHLKVHDMEPWASWWWKSWCSYKNHMKKILVHRTHMWSETIFDLLSRPNCRNKSASQQSLTSCDSSWHRASSLLMASSNSLCWITSNISDPPFSLMCWGKIVFYFKWTKMKMNWEYRRLACYSIHKLNGGSTSESWLTYHCATKYSWFHTYKIWFVWHTPINQ